MRSLSGAVLILAAAILYSTGILASTLFRMALIIGKGGNPFFFEDAYANACAAVVGLLGIAFLIWGVLTDRPWFRMKEKPSN